jgi:hypothetical protein
MKNCPNCGNQEIYRKDLTSLVIHCDCCGYRWETEQVRKPLATARVRAKKLRRTLNISVWLCPIDKNKYSFSINNGNGVMVFEDFPEDRYVSGCYDSIKQALEAGIKEAENE